MPRKQKSVISSTHMDSQGFMLTKEALESMLPYLNGERRVKLGVEHIRSFPPCGIITNGEIVEGDDGQFYLTAENTFFDEQVEIELSDGTTLIKESFSEAETNKPFIESEPNEIIKLSLSTDPANFKEPSGFDDLMNFISNSTQLDFEKSMFGRKSELPDPEFIIQITNTIVAALGIGITKIPQKIGEAVGDDLVKFYELIKTTSFEFIKRTIPATRLKNFVIEFVHEEIVVELIVSTNNPDDVLEALSKEKVSRINTKLSQLAPLNPEKVQFLYNGEWEFNFLLTKNGEAIGTEKAFKKRDETLKRILDEQNKK